MDSQGGAYEKSTYFAPAAKLNESAMVAYGLRKGERRGTVGLGGGNLSLDHQDKTFLLDDDEEFLERFDSRGKKMKLRRGIAAHPPLHSKAQSFAVCNFHPSTYITQKDLKQRATSVVYGKYKQIKRELALIE